MVVTYYKMIRFLFGFHLGIPKEIQKKKNYRPKALLHIDSDIGPRVIYLIIYIYIGVTQPFSYLIWVDMPLYTNPIDLYVQTEPFFRSQVLKELGIEDPLLNVAQELEKVPSPRDLWLQKV